MENYPLAAQPAGLQPESDTHSAAAAAAAGLNATQRIVPILTLLLLLLFFNSKGTGTSVSGYQDCTLCKYKKNQICHVSVQKNHHRLFLHHKNIDGDCVALFMITMPF